MRPTLMALLLAFAAGCSSSATPARVNDAGPPLDTGNGKGLPAMKPPSEGGKPFTEPPKVGGPAR